FRRNRPGYEVNHTSHIVWAVVNRGAAADDVYGFQAWQCDGEERDTNVTVWTNGNRIAIHQHLQSLTTEWIQTTHANIGEHPGAGFIKYLQTGNRPQSVLQIQCAATLEVFLLDH